MALSNPTLSAAYADNTIRRWVGVGAQVTSDGSGNVLFQVELLEPNQANDSGALNAATVASAVGTVSYNVDLPPNARTFTARMRASDNAGSTWTSWITATYTATTEPTEGNAPQARTVTYKQVRDTVAVALEMDLDTGLTSKQAADLASCITKAYRYCLRFDRWEEAIYTDTSVTCTNGLVVWTEVQRGAWFEFWTTDPRPVNNTAMRIPSLKPADNSGIWLDTTLSTVFARYIPRAPRFSSVELVSATTYPADTVRYDVDSGQVVQALTSALGSEVADDTKWLALPILAILEDAVSLRAQAEYRNMEQERDQAADLRAQADDELNSVAFHASLQNRN
jgi:hypothetical protein